MTKLVLQSGYRKCIFIDRAAAGRGEPAWVVRVYSWWWPFPRSIDYHCEDFFTRDYLETCGSKLKPLTPAGPSHWLETRGSVTLINWS